MINDDDDDERTQIIAAFLLAYGHTLYYRSMDL